MLHHILYVLSSRIENLFLQPQPLLGLPKSALRRYGWSKPQPGGVTKLRGEVATRSNHVNYSIKCMISTCT
jgi:hypothetical protein